MSFFRSRCPACDHLISQRTEFQNTEFHTLCARLSRLQRFPLDGSGVKRTTLWWKRFFVAGLEQERGAAIYIGEGVTGDTDLGYERTARLTEEEMAVLIQMTKDWMHQHGSPD